jgi:hypothetical protein
MKDSLPTSVDTERFVLGSILLDSEVFSGALAALTSDDFSLEKHRRILRRMKDVYARGDRVDRVTLAEELNRNGELASVDGLSYLVSLDDGLPQIPNIDSYLRILQEKSTRRRIIYACEHLKTRCSIADEDLAAITTAGQELFAGIESRQGQDYKSVEDIPLIAAYGAADIEYLRHPELPRGAVVALTGDAGSGKSSLATAWARDAWRQKGVPSLFLDRENPIGVIADRFERLGAEDGPGMRFWGGWLPAEAPQPDAPIVCAWAKEHKGLVVVDSFSAFHGGDQNDASETRAFMHRCRRVADLGATAVVIHHDGKSETSKDYRGSSDFKAAVDQAYHVASFGLDGRLDKLVLRPFKSRIGAAAEITYSYADGQFVRGNAEQARETVSEQLTALLRTNPGITGRKFEELAIPRSISRERAREFLNAGVLAGAVRRESGQRNAKRFFLCGGDDAE